MNDSRWLAAVVLCALWSPGSNALNPIQIENQYPGDSDWQLTNPAEHREIEGYASATSVDLGESIQFFVNQEAAASSYSFDMYRMGYYFGNGGHKVLSLTFPPQQQPSCLGPSADYDRFGLIDCDWAPLPPPLQTFTVPAHFVSGFYLVKLTRTSDGKQSYIIFVVRDDARASDFLFQSSVTTYQAYNNWPGAVPAPGGVDYSCKFGHQARYLGKSLYDVNSSPSPCSTPPCGACGHHKAIKVSFNRPYAMRADQFPLNAGIGPIDPDAHNGVGAGEFLTNLTTWTSTHARGWEYNMVRFLEKEGHDVTYATNIDTHRNPGLILGHKAFLSVGHDEYWTWEMRDHVEGVSAQGVSLGFFSANTAFAQIRLEASRGVPDRVIVAYRGQLDFSGQPDPNSAGCTTPPTTAACQRQTLLFRDARIGRPEDGMMGVRFEAAVPGGPSPYFSGNFEVADSSSWVYADAGVVNGSVLPMLIGHEGDQVCGAPSPPSPNPGACASPALAVDVIGHSYTDRTPPWPVDMITHRSASGAWVFSTGTVQWSWGLDAHSVADIAAGHFPGSLPWPGDPAALGDGVRAEAQQMTRNVLERFRSNDRTDVFARGPAPANSIWHRAWVGGQWQPWESLGGVFSSGAAVASPGINRLRAFGVSGSGSSSALWVKSWNGSTWSSDWTLLGKPSPTTWITSDPAATSTGSGEAEVLVRGSDNAMWLCTYSANACQWTPLGGLFSSGPGVSSWGLGQKTAFGIGLDGALWNSFFLQGTGWSGWVSLGKPAGLTLTSRPAAVSWAVGRMDVVARGSDGAVWVLTHSNGLWGTWTSLGGSFQGGPAASSWGQDRLDVFARNLGGTLQRKSGHWDETVATWTWSAWEPLDSLAVSDPASVSWYGLR